MKNFTKILILVFLPLFFLHSQSFEKDLVNSEKAAFLKLSKISKVQYPGDSTIDAVYYKLDVTLNYAARNLTGIVTVSFKSATANLTSFFLDLQNNLTVDSVKMNGNKINFSQPPGEAKLIINLPSPMLLNQDGTIDIYYGGTPGSSGFGSFTFGSDNSGGQAIYTLSEPYGASDWWPCKDTPADKVDSSEVRITVDNNLTAVSNGTLKEIINNGNGTHTFIWKNSYPIAQYLISMAIADYKTYNTYYKYSSTDSLLISNYIWQNSYNSGTTGVLDLVAGMIKIFSEYYGQYPFIKEKYGNAQFGWSGGMEHQTITSVGAFTEDLLVHELAHQWYGDKVTCKTWNDVWLNEGFATFSEGLYFGERYGRGSYDDFIAAKMTQAKSDTQNSVYVKNINSVNRLFKYETTYAKGGVVLHMLRGIVGDSTFFKILRAYNSDPRYSYNSATTSDFRAIADSIYGQNLDYFFNEWVYGVDYPRYSYTWSYSQTGGGGYDVSVNLSQEQRTNPQYFTMPVQLNIVTDIGDTLFTVFNDKPYQEFIFSVKGMPIQIDFDPNNYILKSIKLTGLPEQIIPDKYRLEQNYPNPFNPATVIGYYIPHITKVKLTITDELGRQVKTLVDEEQTFGQYSVSFDGKDLASGVYYYTLRTDNFSQTKKMILLK